jgi:hypothetical protein
LIHLLSAFALCCTLTACGGGGSSEQKSSVAPTGANQAPTIQGKSAASVLANQVYSFEPAATDPDSDVLTFSATNLPSWAIIDSSTGRITGTPSSADVGTYDGIVISVSDGHSTAALPSFSITVSENASGTATLSWMPPTQNTDGSALTDLFGFQILYGHSPDNLDKSITLANPGLSSYVLENLSSGTWYFTVVAVNSIGMTSPLSNIASKTIS